MEELNLEPTLEIFLLKAQIEKKNEEIAKLEEDTLWLRKSVDFLNHSNQELQRKLFSIIK